MNTIKTMTRSQMLGVLPVGTRLAGGKYSVGKVVGRGGFGITYLGSDNRLGRLVAIKEFFLAGSVRHGLAVVGPPNLDTAQYAASLTGFQREARFLARFRHPSIVAVHDTFEENATAYMVMEYINGPTLADELEQGAQPFGEPELVGMVEPLADALDRVHAEGVLHRDIKPENIMLASTARARRPVLLDFGAARDFARGATIRHSVVLTPGYAPLEQYSERARRGPFTDIYALAATLYHAATGEQPPSALERATGSILQPPRGINPLLSRAFDRALLHALEMETNRRPQSAREFFEELRGTRRTTSASTKTATGPAPKVTSATGPTVQVGQPAPAPSVHLQRIKKIATELTQYPTTTTDRFVCPVCRGATMIDPARAVGKVRCPVCRTAGLDERIPASTHDRCPACRKGRLVALTLNAVMNCPACRTGRVKQYVKRRTLFVVREHWARCDSCGAEWSHQSSKDTLTLQELPGGPGALRGSNSIGQTKSRAEWQRMSGRTEQQLGCQGCGAEFDRQQDGQSAWIAVDGDPERVPAVHRGRWRASNDWVKIAAGYAPSDGTHVCSGCASQFDAPEPGMLALVRATQAPSAIPRAYRTGSHPIAIWRAISAGKRNPGVSGRICPACTAEFDEVAPDQLTLTAFQAARDPHGTGRRYHRQRLAREDWARIAAGRAPQVVEQELVDIAEQELWSAIMAGEFADPGAVKSYPTPPVAGEQVLLRVEAIQLRERQSGLYEYDTGPLWITTRRLRYHGKRSNMTVPYDKLTGFQSQKSEHPAGEMLVARRSDRVRPVFFVLRPTPATVVIDGLTLAVRCDASRLAELVRQLRQTP